MYRSFRQQIEAYEGYSSVIKAAAKMLYNATISQGDKQVGEFSEALA